MSLTSTLYKMPIFSNTNTAACPITLYEIIHETTDSLVLPNTGLTLATVGTDIEVTPFDKSLVKEYKFRIRATSAGDVLAGFGDTV